jgi:hypothetical protein
LSDLTVALRADGDKYVRDGYVVKEAGAGHSGVQCIKASSTDANITDGQRYARKSLCSDLADDGKATQSCCYGEAQHTEIGVVCVREGSRWVGRVIEL